MILEPRKPIEGVRYAGDPAQVLDFLALYAEGGDADSPPTGTKPVQIYTRDVGGRMGLVVDYGEDEIFVLPGEWIIRVGSHFYVLDDVTINENFKLEAKSD